MASQLVSTESGEHYTWGRECDGWYLLKTEGLHVIQERMPPETADVMHFHRQATQFFFVLSGHLTVENQDGAVTIAAGRAVLVEPNTRHRARNKSTSDVEFLVVSYPPSHEDRFICE